MALRQGKRMPYVSYQKQGYTDAANQVIVFTTSTDGTVTSAIPLYAYRPVIIPNPFVGPQALRHQKHMPYVPFAIVTHNSFSDAANSSWVFTTSTDGHRGISDVANSGWVFTTPGDGFIDHPGAKTGIIVPNPNVGSQALRRQKRMPYYTYRAAGFADGANSSWVFATSTDGHRGTFASANSTWAFNFSTQGVRGARDGANLVINLATSEDGFLDHPGARTGVLIPNPNVGPQALRQGRHWPYVPSVHGPGQLVLGSADATWVFATPTDGQVITIDIPIANIIVVTPGGPHTIAVTSVPHTTAVGPGEVRTETVD
jgi:hypothetical protein